MKSITVHGETYNIVESFDDVFSDNSGKAVEFIEEYNGYYYIRFTPEHIFDESMYKVNIDNKKAQCIHLIDYFFEVDGKGKRIDPKTIKRGG